MFDKPTICTSVFIQIPCNLEFLGYNEFIHIFWKYLLLHFGTPKGDSICINVPNVKKDFRFPSYFYIPRIPNSLVDIAALFQK